MVVNDPHGDQRHVGGQRPVWWDVVVRVRPEAHKAPVQKRNGVFDVGPQRLWDDGVEEPRQARFVPDRGRRGRLGGAEFGKYGVQPFSISGSDVFDVTPKPVDEFVFWVFLIAQGR